MSRRQNGFGTLVSKGKGKPWLAKWVYKGQTHYKSTGEVDKKKALKELERLTRPWRDEREEDVVRNLQNRLLRLQEMKSKNMLMTEDIWTEFEKKLKSDDVSEGTARIYENAVRMMADWMKPKAKHAADISSKLAEEYLAELSSSVGSATYNIRLVLFKRVWNALSADFQLQASAWENFKKKKAAKSARRTLSQEELKAVMSAAHTSSMKLLLAVGIYTGLRLGDCALLKWSDIDFEHSIMRVVPMKTRKHMDGPVEIPIHAALMSMLKAADHSSEYVSAENAAAYKSGILSGEVVSLFKSCGIETSAKDANGKKKIICGFHSLRHTFVSMAINSGMSPLLVQRIVGHSSVNMTSAYFHENMDKMAEGINTMPNIEI